MKSRAVTKAPSRRIEAVRVQIVGIGASAGGLEAFRELLEHLPPDSGAAAVLIQHLDPTHVSLLGGALAGSTSMPVIEVTSGLRVRPNTVYVIPPNTLMTVRGGILRLVPRGEGRKAPMAIDHFFRSLAADRGARAIGVVLSGTASDGTLGLGAIRAAGGATLAQDPATCRFAGMPESAIAGRVVDHVLSLDRMAAKLTALVARRTPRANAAESAMGAILRLLRERTGVDFTQYKETTVKRRIARRMAARKASTLSGYAEIARNDPAEQEALYEDIFVRVTEFFRDPAAFEALKNEVLPVIVKSKVPGTPIRIWVAACASGEEAYSIAIALLEVLADNKRAIPIQVFGSDISEHAVQLARAGSYAAAATKGIGQARLGRFFTKVDGRYRINKAVRDLCVFVRHDLNNDPPFSRLDLITCRNTLIYFGAELQKRIVPIFHYALNQPGFLMLGRTETLPGFASLFSVVDRANKIFARRPAIGRVGISFPTGSQAPNRGGAPARATGAGGTALEVQREVDQILLSRFAPAGVIVDDNFDIVQFRGRTGAYLEPAPGQANLNLIKMARPGLLTDLRLAIHAAQKDGLPSRREGVRFQTDGEVRLVTIEVMPIRAGGGGAKPEQYLVLFEDLTSGAPGPRRRKAGKGASGKTKPRDTRTRHREELEQELAATREFLQSVIDQKARTNEELQTANDQLLSNNEELQSTNEELETAKEELQSGNEELTTVNEEVQVRNQELAQLSDDLGNLVVTVDLPLVILDSHGRIRRFTAGARGLLNLIPGDVGRPIRDIKPNIDLPELDAWLAEVMQTSVMREAEVRDRNGRWHRLQIRPYRTSDNEINGVVLSLLDIDTLRRSVEDARRARDYADGIVQAVQTPLLILDRDLHARSANRAFYQTFLPPLPIESRPLEALGAGPWQTPGVRERIERAFGDASLLRDLEAECDVPRLGPRRFVVDAREIPAPVGGDPLLLLAIADVTERRLAELARARMQSLEQEARIATKASEDKDAFLAVLSHELRTPLNSILLWAQVLKSEKVDPTKVALGIDTIAESARTQSVLINDLLDVSRIVSGKLQLTLEPVALAPVVATALEGVQRQADEKGVKLEVSVDPRVGEVVADANRLRQIVWNLASNAVKFTPAGGVVEVSAERHGDRARITVRDTGAGIEAAFLPRVFDRFAQADSSSTRPSGGLGLGLAIVAHLVKRHGGTINATSPGPGQGATFTVTIPVIAGAERPGGVTSPVPPESP